MGTRSSSCFPDEFVKGDINLLVSVELVMIPGKKDSYQAFLNKLGEALTDRPDRETLEKL